MASKPQRLTQKLNIVLAKASAAVSIGKDNPEHAQKCLAEADAAIDEAQKIMGEIMRAAESI
ncbi:MAG TPA: hypothetical protein VJ063_12045 [Verrucomicrobiae bacterium]|nr:hypothetical protein [Verrucomicrobiae bacterium]